MKKGFTLIELLVVLVIIGVLVALILPNALKAINQANIKSAASTLRNIDSAVKLCYSTTQDWSKCSSMALVEGNGAGPGGTGYMDVLPNKDANPWGGTYTLTGDNVNGYQSFKTGIFPNWPNLTPVNEK